MSTKDPLSGQRQAINDHKASGLMWPLVIQEEEQPCPVRVGDVFHLRSCSIEITETRRIKHEGQRKWRAAFTRTDRVADKLWLLGRSTDYVHDPDLAVGLRDDVHEAATLDVVDQEDRSPEHKNAGEPPELEAVPPHEVANCKGTLDAHQRYLLEMAHQRASEESLPLWERIRRLEEHPGTDLTRPLARIRQGVEAAEAKRRRLARKVPSDRAA